MGTVESCSVQGFEMRFYSNDHYPPHLHLRKNGDWEIVIDLLFTTKYELRFEVKWPKSFPGPDAKMKKIFRKMICDNRASLISEFERKVAKP